VASSASSVAPTLTDIQSKLHNTKTSLANHVDKVRALEGVIAECNAIKQEVGLLRQLIEKMTNNYVCSREEEELGAGDDDAIVPRELERVEEEDEGWIEKQEQQFRRMRRAELGRPRTPEPMGLGMTPLLDDKDQGLNSPRPPSGIDKLFEWLTTLSSKLELPVKLSRSFQAQHAAAQSTISTLKLKVTSLESLVKAHRHRLLSKSLNLLSLPIRVVHTGAR
jgi:hypothetical protein